MRRALASLLSFAATCLCAPALADELAATIAPGLAGLLGYTGTRVLLWGAHKLQSEDAPGEERCPPRKTSSPP